MKSEYIKKLRQISAYVTILYVEDDHDIAVQTVQFLKKVFSHVDEAHNAHEGLRLWQSKKHDIVITDIRMPGMNGIDMVRQIKSVKNDQSVLVTSAHDDTEYLLQCIDIGVEKFLLKPFDVNRLLDAVAQMVVNSYNAKRNAQLEKKIEADAVLYKELLDTIEHPTVLFEDTEIIKANRSFRGLFEEDEQLTFRGLTERIVEWSGKENGEAIAYLKEHPNSKATLKTTSAERQRYFLAHFHELPVSRKWMLFMADVSIMQEQCNSMRLLLDQDEVTRLENRRALSKRLTELAGEGFEEYRCICFRIKKYDHFRSRFGEATALTFLQRFAEHLKAKKARYAQHRQLSWYAWSENHFVVLYEAALQAKIEQMFSEFGRFSFAVESENVAFETERADLRIKSAWDVVRFEEEIERNFALCG
ncbi:MAG: response regulator [Campylobacterales bacterium]|nr:response regulator [Campylobacterales bacterium]